MSEDFSKEKDYELEAQRNVNRDEIRDEVWVNAGQPIQDFPPAIPTPYKSKQTVMAELICQMPGATREEVIEMANGMGDGNTYTKADYTNAQRRVIEGKKDPAPTKKGKRSRPVGSKLKTVREVILEEYAKLRDGDLLDCKRVLLIAAKRLGIRTIPQHTYRDAVEMLRKDNKLPPSNPQRKGVFKIEGWEPESGMMPSFAASKKEKAEIAHNGSYNHEELVSAKQLLDSAGSVDRALGALRLVELLTNPF